MKVQIHRTRLQLGKAAAAEASKALRRVISEKGTCRVIFAAAPSQNEFLEALTSDTRIDFSKVQAFHMDEYIGLSAEAPQRFANFLRDAVFSKAPFGRVETISSSEDPEREIQRYTRLLQEAPVDLVFMGIGENGHIAFNDPHVAKFDDPLVMKKVSLDDVCRQQQVNDGCFPSLSGVPKEALTLTVPTLFGASELFCMVPGKTKTWAVGRTVLGEIRETLPATILRLHPNATLYVDADSGAELLDAGYPLEP